MNRKQYFASVGRGINMGLRQQLGIAARVHYHGKLQESDRVLTLVMIGLNPAYMHKVERMSAQLAMWAGLSSEVHIRVTHQSRSLLIEIPKPPELCQAVTLERLQNRKAIRRGTVATIGLDLKGIARRIDFRKLDMAHVFISGQTRSGKTNTQRLIGWNLAHNSEPTESKLIVFDVAKRGYKWADFGNVAHLAHPVITEVSEADKVLAWASQEINRRADERRVTPKMFLLVDELKALTDDSQVASDYLARIASVGGEFGLHLILATQYPQIKLLGNSELKRNVTTRLCGRVDDAQAASNALGIAGSGAEALQGYGDFLLKDSDGLTRLAVAKIEDSHIERLPRVESIQSLELPDLDIVNSGALRNIPDELEPSHVAVALFNPQGINKLGRELGIGNNKATRVKQFADGIRQWANENAPTKVYNFLSSEWVECNK